MRRWLEQLVVDAAELTVMLLEGILFGLPAAVLEIAGALEPYAVELIALGVIVWVMLM